MNLLSFLKAYESGEVPAHWKWIDLARYCLQQYTIEHDGSDDPLFRPVAFITEQLHLLKTSVHSRRYSSSLLTFAYILFASSASCYDTLREQNVFCLPHNRTIHRISQKLDTSKGNTNKTYFQMRLAKLNVFAKNVVLLIDEVYISGKVEYSGGEIIGHCDGGVAKTVLCFMISSVCGSYRDIVSLIPIKQLTADHLHSHFLETLQFIENVGFSVVAVCLDNHPVNRSFYKQKLCGGTLKVSVPHPCRPTSPLFLLFDMTHNIKNVFNNFERRKLFIMPRLPPSLSSSLVLPTTNAENSAYFSADFSHIQQLYLLESDKPVKAAHKLKKACFNPSSIEKASVKFAAAIFHESTHSALTYYSDSSNRHSWKETSLCVQLFCKLWKITNVKTPAKGYHKRDLSQDPVTSVADWKLSFLLEFATYLEDWERSNMPGLSRETFLALKQTISAFVPLCRYLLSEHGFKYILLGSIQSDNLEGRFGWYRQLSGGNYFISLRQVRESEKKIKIISLLKHSGFSVSDLSESLCSHNAAHLPVEAIEAVISKLPYSNPPNMDDCNVIYYIAGFIARSVSAAHKCFSCSNALKASDQCVLPIMTEANEISDFFNQINRGGLCDPSDFVYAICLRCWSIFSSIKSSPKLSTTFLSSSNARDLFIGVIETSLQEDELLYHSQCEHGHDLIGAIVRKFFNCMAKNWIAGLNEKITSSKERKIKKLKS
jgi:hypothetical protein